VQWAVAGGHVSELVGELIWNHEADVLTPLFEPEAAIEMIIKLFGTNPIALSCTRLPLVPLLQVHASLSIQGMLLELE
jgi:hypothetical protein